MGWLITYCVMIVMGLFASGMLFFKKLIPYETRALLNDKQLEIYRNNLIQVSTTFTLVSILFLVEHIYHIRNLFYYLLLILLTWYAVRKLVANLNMLNKAKEIKNK